MTNICFSAHIYFLIHSRAQAYSSRGVCSPTGTVFVDASAFSLGEKKWNALLHNSQTDSREIRTSRDSKKHKNTKEKSIIVLLQAMHSSKDPQIDKRRTSTIDFDVQSCSWECAVSLKSFGRQETNKLKEDYSSGESL